MECSIDQKEGNGTFLKEVNMCSMLKTQSGWQKVTEQERRGEQGTFKLY